MRTRLCLMMSGLVVAAAHSASMTDAQQQSSKPRPWPCGGRLDPSYFRLAEASGGHLHLLAPSELGESAAELMTAFGIHPQTLFRVAGEMNTGVHEFRVPIDSALDSVLFSISVQCLQTADVTRPSGVPLAGGDGVTDLSNFVAQRMVIVKRPEAGIWTIRAAGTGISGVMVQARSALGITDLQFAAGSSKAFTRVPSAGTENVVRIGVSGRATDLQASIINAAFRRIAPLPLTPGETEGSYLSHFTPGTQEFRVLVEGKDADGAPFQRVHAPLLTARQ